MHRWCFMRINLPPLRFKYIKWRFYGLVLNLFLHWVAATICSRWFLTRGFFYPEDEGDMFLRNIGSHKIYTGLHPRRRHSSLEYLQHMAWLKPENQNYTLDTVLGIRRTRIANCIHQSASSKAASHSATQQNFLLFRKVTTGPYSEPDGSCPHNCDTSLL
jgi:hypothetical protein